MSNLLDWIKSLDRDKEKKGFQLRSPEKKAEIAKAKKQIQMVTGRPLTTGNPFLDIAKISGQGFMKAAAEAPESFKTALTPVIGKHYAEKSGYMARGAAQLNPAGWANMIAPNSASGKEWRRQAPKHEDDIKSQRLGRNLYGMLLTAPIGGGSALQNIGSRAIQGGTLGGGMNTIKNVATGEKWSKDLGKGIAGGIENSWQLAFTNLATDKLAARYVPELTSDAMQKGGQLLKDTVSSGGKEAAKQVFKQNAVNIFKRALLETPIENTWFTAINNLSGEDKRKFVQAWTEDFFSTLGGNIAYAGLAAGKQGLWDLNKNEINAAGEALVKTYKKMFAGGKEGQGGYIKIGPDQKVKIDSQIDNNLKRVFGDNEKFIKDFKDSYEKSLKQSVNYEQFQKNLTADLYSKNRNMSMDTVDVIVRRILPENMKDSIDFKSPAIKIKDEAIDPLAQEYEQSMDSFVEQKEEPKDIITILEERQAERIANGEQTTRTHKTSNPKESGERVTRWLKKSEETVLTLKQQMEADGSSMEEALRNKNNGVKDKYTDILQKIFDRDREIARSLGFEVGDQPNYIPFFTEEMIDKALEKPMTPDSFGDVIAKPMFAEERTGKLTIDDIELSERAILAHQREAVRNLMATPEEQLRIKTANELKKEYKGKIDEEIGAFKKGKEDFVKTLKKGFEEKVDAVAKAKRDYLKRMTLLGIESDSDINFYKASKKSKVGEIMDIANRSVSDRAELAGEQFRNDFFRPFREIELETNKYASQLNKLSKEELIATFQPRNINNLESVNKENLVTSLIRSFYSDKLKEATDIFYENAGKAEFEQPYLKDLANDIFDEYVGNNIRGETYTEEILKTIRKWQGRSLVAFNISSAVQNIFELPRGFALVDKENAKKAMKNVMDGVDYIGKYGVEQTNSTALEMSGVAKTMSKIDSAGYKMFQTTENWKDQFFLGAFEEQGKSKGLEGDDLVNFVIKKFDRYAIKYGKGQTTGLYKSPVVKTAFQFGQYSQKELVSVIDQTANAIKGDKGSQQFLKKYLLYSTARMVALKVLLGTVGFGNQTGTPLDLTTDLISGKMPWTPSFQLLINGLSRVTDKVSGKEKTDYEKTKRNKDLIRAATGVSPIPGMNQFYWKTGRSAFNIAKGYQETSGGNIANPTSRDPFNVTRSLLFGPGYDAQRQDYGKRYRKSEEEGRIGDASLSKAQSATFRQLPQDQREDYYYSITDWNQRKSEINKENKEKDKERDKKPWFKIGGKEEAIKIDTSTPLRKEQEKTTIREKIKYGEPVTPEELKFYYLDEYESMPSKTKYDLNQKEEKAYEIGQKIIEDEFLPQEDKNAIYKNLETSEEELSYYKVAKDTAGDKELYVEEMVETMGDDEKLEFLLMGRTVVNDKLLVSDALIKKLVKSGQITASQGDALKSVIFKKDNSYDGEDAIKMGDNIYKPEKQELSGSGGRKTGFGTDNVLKVKMPTIKRSAPKSIKISTGSGGKTYTIKVTKPNLSKRKNWRSIKLKY